MRRRFRAVYHIPKSDELSSYEWFRINGSSDEKDRNDAADMMKWLICQECVRLASTFDALEETETENTKEAAEQMFEDSLDEQIFLLRDVFSPSVNTREYVTSKRIKEVITEDGLPYADKHLGFWVKTAFPGKTTKERRSIGGKRETIWKGITENRL